MSQAPQSDVSREDVLSEMRIMIRQMDERYTKQQRTIDEMRKEITEHKEIQKEQAKKIDNQEKEIADLNDVNNRYRKLGGDTFYYMQAEDLLSVLRAQCNGDKDKEKETEQWVKKVQKNGRVKILISACGAAAVGAASAGVAIGATHLCAAVGGTLAVTAVGCAPAGVIIAIGVGAALTLYFVSLGILKVYRCLKARKTKRTELKTGISDAQEKSDKDVQDEDKDCNDNMSFVHVGAEALLGS